MKRSNSLCFLVSMAVSRTARHESTAANDLTRESRRSVNRSRTCAYMFALRSARGTKLAKRSDAQDLQTDLKREAMLTAPDHIWVADITYIRLAQEFVYLAVVMDAFSRKVVGWALADHLQASLPLEALDKAIAS